VVPFLVLTLFVLGLMASRWPDPVGPLIFLGLVGLSVLMVDALLGWRALRVPLLGGTMFDGARFYGLPNAFLHVLLAGGLFLAAMLPAFPGFLVLVGAGDVGGAIVLFFSAGLWWVLRTRTRFGLKEVSFVGGVTGLGLGIVLLANRYLPGTPTHAAAFVEETGNGLGGLVREFGDRLGVALGQVRDVPPAVIPLLGLVVVLALVVTRRGPVGWGLGLAGRRWEHALIVLTVAGVAAFFANDTGVAAAAPVFLYAMTGMAYPAFLAAAGRALPRGVPHE
jgi:hypothetical protein